MTSPKRGEVHVLTPGDHFSPRTGSAVPTVVDGLARTAPVPADVRVLVARGTMPDRYPSAEAVEYVARDRPLHSGRYLDPILGRVGLPRWQSRRTWAACLRDQGDWPPAIIVGHNGPQLMPGIDQDRHAAVLYAHNQLFQTYSRSEAARTLRKVDRIICVSDYLAGRIADRVGSAAASRIAVVPNGVDTEAFHPRADPARSGDSLHVMFVGRMIHEKGADLIIQALLLLNRTDITATILGSGGFDPAAPLTPFETELRRLAAPLGSRVDFRPTAARTDVPRLLREADVIMIPSRWPDPCPLTVGEGLATGVPVIAAAVGGIPEMMGEAGVQVPQDDPGAIATALEAFADDEQLRLTSGVQTRARAMTRDWGWTRRNLNAALAELR